MGNKHSVGLRPYQPGKFLAEMKPLEDSQVEVQSDLNCCWKFQDMFLASGSRGYITAR